MSLSGAVVADNIYALLQQAWSVASTGDAAVYGVEIAIVTNVQDPDQQGRVKVCFPRLPGKPESGWARISKPAAGGGRGFYWIPEVNDEVLVAFERGQANRPYVLGALWNGKDKPMQDAYTDDNTTRMIMTKSGHQIILSDKDGEEKIVISDKSGKRTVTFDVKSKKLLIEDGEGDVEIHAKKKLVFDCEDLEIKTKKTGKIEIGSTFDLKVADKANLKAGPKMTIKAEKVDLNPSSGAGSGLANLAWRAARAAAAALAAAAAGGQGGGTSGGGAAGGGAAAKGAGPGGDLSADVAGPGAGPAAGPGSGAGAGTSAGAGAGAATEPSAVDAVAPGQVQVQVVSIAGKAQAGLEFELTAPDGTTKHAGKTDAQGSFLVDSLPKSGECSLDLPDVKPAPKADPSAAGRIRFVEGGVKVKIGAASVVEIPPRIRRGRLTGMLFETDKAFLKPEVMTGIRMLKKLYASFPDLVVLVSGHTDRVGDALHNRGLSEERADSVRHFLVDDAEEWMKWYAGKKPNSKRWGVTEDQHMLRTVEDGAGQPFYSGPVSGEQDGPTTQAVKDFQGSRLLTVTGKPDGDTRRALVEAYMKLDAAPLPRDPPLASHGCGKTHPVSPPDAPPEEQIDRRVEIFLFEGQIDPPPKTPCPSGGCTEYKSWVAHTVLTVDLDQPPGALAVKVVDEAGNPIKGAQVHAAGPLVLDGQSGDDGSVAGFDEIVPGSYQVVADAPDFQAADGVVEVPSGGAGKTTLTLKAALPGRVLVRLRDADTAAPVKGATVTLEPVPPRLKASETTNASGEASLDLPQSSGTLICKARGYDDLKAKVVVPAGAASPFPVELKIKRQVVIELVNRDGKSLANPGLAFFDGPFDVALATWMNKQPDADNFVAGDSRRFFLRIKDVLAASTIDAGFRTLFGGGQAFDVPTPSDELTLVEKPAASGTFVSESLALVNDQDDQKLPTNTGPSGTFASLTRGQKGHRIRQGDMFSQIEVEYPKGNKKRFSIFDRAKARTLPLQICIVSTSSASYVPAVPTANIQAQIIDRDLRVLRQCYERLNISVFTHVPGSNKFATTSVGGETFIQCTLPAGANCFSIDDSAEQKLGTLFPGDANTLRLFYVAGLRSGNRGETITPVDFAGKAYSGSCFLDINIRTPYSPAHECGHAITNKSVTKNGGHYKQPASFTKDHLNAQNLMRNSTSSSEGTAESKRFWEGNDADAFDQINQILKVSPFIR